MDSYLCDTNVISELMRRKPHASVAAWLSKRERISLSVVTVEEIFFGLERRKLSAKRAWFDCFLSTKCEVLPIDLRIAEHAGRLRGELSAKGLSRAQADIFIAATAAVNGLIVVTRNTRDFENTAVSVLDPFV